MRLRFSYSFTRDDVIPGRLGELAFIGVLATLLACSTVDAESVSSGQGGGAATTTAVQSSSGTAQGGGGGEDLSSSSVSTTSTGGTAYQPDPIPTIDEEPPQGCPAQTPAGYFQFLDDSCDDKRVPGHVDRDLACPSVDSSHVIPLKDGGTVSYQSADETPVVETVLQGFVPSELMMTAILIRRVNGEPYFRYLSTGDHDEAFQPWSTTKFLAAANAASNLRIKSNYALGLEASTQSYSLGDLISSMHAYDSSPFSSNSLGRYFHDIGGRTRANAMIHEGWLDRPSSETFGGNYGSASPPLGFVFLDNSNNQVTITPDSSSGPANHLSTFTQAEALKRLVLHRELAAQRLPGIQWEDLRVLFYGAESSNSYGDWGGMNADTAIYMQTGHDIDYIDSRSQGRWRIFSKLGLGSSGQFLNVAYACLPVLDDSQQAVPGWGRELVIAAHLPTGGSSWTNRDRLLAKAYRAVITRVVDGRL